jgi:hypothetical protein
MLVVLATVIIIMPDALAPAYRFFAIDGDDEGGDDADIVKVDFWGLQCTLMGFETRLQLRGRAGKELVPM